MSKKKTHLFEQKDKSSYTTKKFMFLNLKTAGSLLTYFQSNKAYVINKGFFVWQVLQY